MDRRERVTTIEEFGAKLLETGDLDPLYIALDRSPSMKADRAMLHRWLFAYWCCYNAGASSYIAEAGGTGFWERLGAMAANETLAPIGERWPRGHERRHFRGAKAVDAVASYSRRFSSPEQPAEWFGAGRYPADHALGYKVPYTDVRSRVMTLPQFGPWIAFKVADMLERVAGVPVSFAEADVLMFDQPYKSALQVWASWDGTGSEIARSTVTTDDERVRRVARKLGMFFAGKNAPPRHDRPVNVQEIETILCKWKSHNTGHYPVGIDSKELREGLHKWSKVSHLAHELYHYAPGGGL